MPFHDPSLSQRAIYVFVASGFCMDLINDLVSLHDTFPHSHSHDFLQMLVENILRHLYQDDGLGSLNDLFNSLHIAAWGYFVSTFVWDWNAFPPSLSGEQPPMVACQRQNYVQFWPGSQCPHHHDHLPYFWLQQCFRDGELSNIIYLFWFH